MDAKLIAFIVLIVCVVIIPGFRSALKIWVLLRQEKIWENIAKNISTITLDDIHGFPEPTHYVLNCVLTAQAGVGKPQAVPAALEHLAATLDAPLHTLRSLSYFSVLLGLLGTVSVLAITFGGVKDITGIEPALLGHVYTFNAAAISLAAVLYLFHVYLRWRGDHLVLMASQTLGRLQSEIPENVDPQLVAALEAVGHKFTQWGEEIYARHRQEAEALSREMRGLGEAIQGMVQGMIAARRTEEEGIIPLLRSQDEKIELLSQRLDARFRELAEPIQKTLPLIEQWQGRIEELGNLLQTMLEADLPGNTKGLTLATKQLAVAVGELPQLVQRHFQGIKKVIAAGLQDAVKEGWQQTVAPAFVDLSSRFSLMLKAHQDFTNSVARLPQAVAENVTASLMDEKQKTVQPSVNKMIEAINQSLTAHQGLEKTLNQTATDLPRNVNASLQPLVQAHTELAGKFQDLAVQLQVLQDLPPTLVEALKEALKHTGDLVTANVSERLRHLWQRELAPQAAACSKTLQESLQEQQKLTKQLYTLYGDLILQLETERKMLLDQMTQRLPEAFAAKGDGHLRDIVTSLQQLQIALENMGKRISTSGGDQETSPRRGWFWRGS